MSVLIVENRVLFEGLKNGQELLHFDVIAEDVKKRVAIHSLALLECLEYNIFGRVSLVGDRSTNLVEVVCAH